MNSETPYVLPGGERVRVIDTAAASEHLANLLERFREGKPEPLVFGDAGQPEGVVISWDEWRRLAALAADADGFDHAYQTTRERLASNEPSVPLEDVASEIGWDLDEDIDDSDLPKQ